METGTPLNSIMNVTQTNMRGLVPTVNRAIGATGVDQVGRAPLSEIRLGLFKTDKPFPCTGPLPP